MSRGGAGKGPDADPGCDANNLSLGKNNLTDCDVRDLNSKTRLCIVCGMSRWENHTTGPWG